MSLWLLLIATVLGGPSREELLVQREVVDQQAAAVARARAEGGALPQR